MEERPIKTKKIILEECKFCGRDMKNDMSITKCTKYEGICVPCNF